MPTLRQALSSATCTNLHPLRGSTAMAGTSDAMGSCTTFLHYSTNSTTQIYHAFDPDLTQWHTLRAQRRNHVVTIWLDDLSTPVWTYDGDSTTLPDTVKTVVLQQECLVTGCPSTTSGSEDIQIAWITVDVPS